MISLINDAVFIMFMFIFYLVEGIKIDVFVITEEESIQKGNMKFNVRKDIIN
jgi:hypothetical protein